MQLNRDETPNFSMALIIGLLSFIIGKYYLGLLPACILAIISGGGILCLHFKNKIL